ELPPGAARSWHVHDRPIGGPAQGLCRPARVVDMPGTRGSWRQLQRCGQIERKTLRAIGGIAECNNGARRRPGSPAIYLAARWITAQPMTVAQRARACARPASRRRQLVPVTITEQVGRNIEFLQPGAAREV